MKRIHIKVTCVLAIVITVAIALSSCAGGVKVKKEQMALSNKNADENTKRVYQYLCETFENSVITGQQESFWLDSPEYEMNYIFENTGKLPAIRGLDFMGNDFESVVSRSEEWWQKGGIVTICWHCGPDFAGDYNNCKNDEIADWEAVLTDGTPENIAFIEAMDKAGAALKELQDNGVTVLWRPFHEFDGQWFWWGKGGSDNFKRLWVMMYDHFTNDLGLNNLIWVLGFSHNGKDIEEWYPGDEYCDVVGADSYDTDKNGAEKRLYDKVLKVTKGTKPLCFHECGLIPTEKQLKSVKWCWFMTWHTEYLTDSNTKEALSEIYNSDYSITLDKLPSFTEE